MRRCAVLLICCCTVGLTGGAAAESLPLPESEIVTLDRVLDAARQHFPKILEASEKTLASEGKALAAEGAFDLELQADSLHWGDGFYDGQSVDTRLVKPLPFANTKVFAGYRAGSGSFPVYQDQFDTLDAGEVNLGLVLSLLRDRAIDERRFTLSESQLQVVIADLELDLTRLSVHVNATRAYWKWLASGRKREIYQGLLEIALARDEAFEKRVAQGDLAAVALVENRQNVLRRKVLVNEAERAFNAASIQLSLYLRDDTGTPLRPTIASLPASFPAADAAVLESLDADISFARNERPEIEILATSSDIEEQRAEIGRNRLLPKVDVSLKASRDFGSGDVSRRGTEVLVGFEVALPVQQRRGAGAVAEAQANLRRLAHRRRLVEDSLVAEIHRLANDIEAAMAFVALTTAEVEAAERMERAERQLFAEGASDFFLVNLREERTASARVQNVESHLTYHASVASYYAATANREALQIE